MGTCVRIWEVFWYFSWRHGERKLVCGLTGGCKAKGETAAPRCGAKGTFWNLLDGVQPLGDVSQVQSRANCTAANPVLCPRLVNKMAETNPISHQSLFFLFIHFFSCLVLLSNGQFGRDEASART